VTNANRQTNRICVGRLPNSEHTKFSLQTSTAWPTQRTQRPTATFHQLHVLDSSADKPTNNVSTDVTSVGLLKSIVHGGGQGLRSHLLYDIFTANTLPNSCFMNITGWLILVLLFKRHYELRTCICYRKCPWTVPVLHLQMQYNIMSDCDGTVVLSYMKYSNFYPPSVCPSQARNWWTNRADFRHR